MKPDPILIAVGEVLIQERKFTHEQMKALEARIDEVSIVRGAARTVIRENVAAIRRAIEPSIEMKSTITGDVPQWVQEALA